eukprot:CAMPEP_0182532708 /NCGR_PEP_ID=MMETSP1323-20130603/12214_1 /TAXON_ID=236787 /ORGANISM="Florenciella parvula, Strain RCC1693" /LENGTH=44 /DNA_ID= /DNA_START= /DNA_END= /DNA_ORIENTATION=
MATAGQIKAMKAAQAARKAKAVKKEALKVQRVANMKKARDAKKK